MRGWTQLLLGWLAIAHLAGPPIAGDGQPFLIAAGPFATQQQCLVFLRGFVRVYHGSISGARLERAYCLEPNLGVQVEVAVP